MMRIENNLTQNYERLSSLQRINSASDDAAGLAISQRMEAQTGGIEQGSKNAADMQNLVNTADGVLCSIHDNLNRMRELSVQASNGILSSSNREIIQKEIGQIKEEIGEQVKNTEFNTQKLIDGSFSDKNVASNASGKGMQMSIENTGLAELGIKDFDVTGNFDISDIDYAIDKVSSARGQLGAQSNRLEHTMNSNQVAAENQRAARSRIVDLNVGKEVTAKNTNQILQSYRIAMQQSEMEQTRNRLDIFL